MQKSADSSRSLGMGVGNSQRITKHRAVAESPCVHVEAKTLSKIATAAQRYTKRHET